MTIGKSPGDFPKPSKENNQEELRQALILELAQRKAEAMAEGKIFYFNNLWMKLPDENGISEAYKLVDFLKRLDKPMTAEISKFGDSQLSLQTTYRKFFELFNEIFQRLGLEKKIDVKEVQRVLKTVLQEPTSEKGIKARDRLQIFLEPIYIELRLLGFSHYDLWR